jgi:8-oxo-dGTP pyrophosphatase MutT (NUDIX family)
MVDDGTFAGAAAKEIEEELGLSIHESELINLTELALAGPRRASSHAPPGSSSERLPNAMFPSAGGSDEHIPIFACKRRVPRAQLAEWTGRMTGLRKQGEKITLKLVRLEDLWWEGARDAKALAAFALWKALRSEVGA